MLEKVMADFDPYAEHAGRTINGAGLDLSRAKDLTSAAFCIETGTKRVTKADGTEAELPTYDLWVESWTPGDTMDERTKIDHVPYRLWSETMHKDADGNDIAGQPYLNAPEGGRVRFDHVAAHFARVDANMGVGELGYDKYVFDKFQEELDNYGLSFPTVAHPQGGKKRARPSDEKIEAAKLAGLPAPLGHWMPGSVSKLEELILEERVRIRRSPVTLTALMGVAMETDPLMGNQWFNKSKATVRIDPAVAAAMAVGVATEGVAATTVSFWQVMDPNEQEADPALPAAA
jgi:phage terminase large subunit-like protein